MIHRRTVIIAVALLSCVLIAAGVLANGTPSIDWWVMGSGGGETSAGDVTLDATLGQPVVGISRGGSISLEAGYWTGAGAMINNVYLPYVSR